MQLRDSFQKAGATVGKALTIGAKVTGYTLAAALATAVALKGADIAADGLMAVCQEAGTQLDRAVGPRPHTGP